MKDLILGVQVDEASAPATVAGIVRAEALGIPAAWLTLGGLRPDSLAVLAAAAVRTERIQLGTAIVPTFPRHPLAAAQGARAVAELAPGRFRLGVGPSHQPYMAGALGLPFVKPLTHLREYMLVLRGALQAGGQLAFAGEFFRVQVDCGRPPGVPVLASALREKAFHLVGEVGDGAISWLCPLPYLERVAIPAMAAGALVAGRPRPPLVMQVLVSVHGDPEAVRAEAARRIGHYTRLPFYREMFVRAGYPEAAAGTVSPALVDAVVLHGDEAAVAAGLRRVAASPVAEVICSVLAPGPAGAASASRTLNLLAELSRQD